MMRKRKEITGDGSRPEILALEVLLDIRELLVKASKTKRTKKNSSFTLK